MCRETRKSEWIMVNYKEIEQKFEQVLSLLNDDLQQQEIDQVCLEFYVGEWVLALESLCAILYEKNVSISPEVYHLLQEIGLNLEASQDTWQCIQLQVVVAEQTE